MTEKGQGWESKYLEFIFKGKALIVKQLKKGGVVARYISIGSLKGKFQTVSCWSVRLFVALPVK